MNVAVQAVWLMLPAALANMAPALLRGRLRRLEAPVDGGATLRGRRVFGDNKTWRGLLAAPVVGAVVVLAQRALCEAPAIAAIGPVDYRATSPLLGLLLGAGAIGGDLVKSFFKRQMDVAPGVSWVPFDQVDWIVGALLAASPMVRLEAPLVGSALLLGVCAHVLTNLVGDALRRRRAPP